MCVCVCRDQLLETGPGPSECILTLIERLAADDRFVSRVSVMDAVRLDAPLLVFILLVDTFKQRQSFYFWRNTKVLTTLTLPVQYLAKQPLLMGDSTTSSSTPASLLLLWTTWGPGPDRWASGTTEGVDGMLGAVGLIGSLLKSLLEHLPFRLSDDVTWLIWPSSGRQAKSEGWTSAPSTRGHLYVRLRQV